VRLREMLGISLLSVDLSASEEELGTVSQLSFFEKKPTAKITAKK
jgi:hypothetical protein